MKNRPKNYTSVHQWLYYHYGQADKCQNPSCPKISKVFTWAKKRKAKYEKKRGNFLMLCRSCHAKYDCTDETRRKMARIRKGKAFVPLAYQILKKKLTGVPLPKKTRLKISAKMKGRINRQSSKKVFQYDKSGLFIKEYPSLAEAERQTGIDQKGISHCCRKRQRTTSGYIWSLSKLDEMK
jgi:hypothetical protein